MAQVPTTEVSYVSDGITTVYDFDFPYLQSDEVFVTVNGVSVPFTFLTGSTHSVELATPPIVTNIVRIYRSTEAFKPMHLFAAGTPFLPRYVDENNTQFLYALQEGINAFDGVVDAAQEIADRSVRVPTSEVSIAPLPGISERVGRLLSFDTVGNPIAVLPAAGSATELSVALSNAINPVQGAGMIGRNAQVVNSFAELRTLRLLSTPSKYAISMGYYKAGDGGGGVYYSDPEDITTPDNGGTCAHGADGGRIKLVWSGVLDVKQCGARGIGSDDTTSLQTAINSGAADLKYPPGVYGLNQDGLTLASNQTWRGAGSRASTLRMLVQPTNDMLYASNKSTIYIFNIGFDGNGQLTRGTGHYPSLLPTIHLSECSDVEVSDCRFLGFDNCGLLANVIKTGRFRRNFLNRGVAATYINHGIGVAGESTDIDIDDNDCVYTQISINATHSSLTRNRVRKWGFSAGINTQATPSCHNLYIAGNFCYDSNQAPDISPYWPQGIENWAPDSVIVDNTCYGNYGDGIGNGGKRCLIGGNNCYNNRGYGIYNLYQDSTYNASGSILSDNRLHDTRVGAARTQVAGYAEQEGGLTGIMYADNTEINNLGASVFNCVDRAIAAQYPWTTVTVFTNGWLDYGGGTFSPVGYRKDNQGVVRLRGAIKSGTVAVPAFTLPQGHRPPALMYFPVVANNAFGMLAITAGGGVTLQAGATAYVALDGISFCTV